LDLNAAPEENVQDAYVIGLPKMERMVKEKCWSKGVLGIAVVAVVVVVAAAIVKHGLTVVVLLRVAWCHSLVLLQRCPMAWGTVPPPTRTI
jgi:hypothetical protein